MTARPTLARPSLPELRRMLQRDGRIEGLVVSWDRKVRWMTFPTGHRAWYGSISVAAPGYRARTMTVHRDEDGTMVR